MEAVEEAVDQIKRNRSFIFYNPDIASDDWIKRESREAHRQSCLCDLESSQGHSPWLLFCAILSYALSSFTAQENYFDTL
ncbi:hypothetical protein PO124_06900 [Bacillus licheniformis]|nr:hypothetical protein [Bacillus licheniformis]